MAKLWDSTHRMTPPATSSKTSRVNSPVSLTTTMVSESVIGNDTMERVELESLNCAMDHSLRKYFGSKLLTNLFWPKNDATVDDEDVDAPPLARAAADDESGAGDAEAYDVGAVALSGIRNTCTVPLSLVAPNKLFRGENASE